MDAAKAATGGSASVGAIAGLSPDQRLGLQAALAKIAADQEMADRAADLAALQATLADTASARAQTVALAQKGSTIAWGAPVVSVLVLLSFGAAVLIALTTALPAGSETVITLVIGALTTQAGAVTNFWLGSSAGSATKTQLLADSIPSGQVATLRP